VDPLLASATVVFGLIFGSFLNVCIYRLPRDLSVINPRWSACPNCRKRIAFYDNVPVLSWLLLRGKCRQCKSPISPRYLTVEVLNAVLFLACAWYFGWTLATLGLSVVSGTLTVEDPVPSDYVDSTRMVTVPTIDVHHDYDCLLLSFPTGRSGLDDLAPAIENS